MIDAMIATAIKIFLTRAGGADVQQSLNSATRDQWITLMFDEIVESMLKSTRTF